MNRQEFFDNSNPSELLEAWQYAYDAFGREISVTRTSDPHGSPQTIRTESRQYDELGRLTQTISPEGILAYSYDNLNRLTAVKVFDTTDDPATDNPKRHIRYTYDTFGRLKSVIENLQITSYNYDLRGNLRQTITPNGITTTNTYDGLNRLVQLTHTRRHNPTGSATYINSLVSDYAYTLRPDGKRTSVIEQTDVNGDGDISVGSAVRTTPTGLVSESETNQITWNYDALGRLISKTFENGENLDALYRLDNYGYDLTGNRTVKISDTDGDGSVDQTTSYTVDANDRLIEEQISGGNTTNYSNDGTQQRQKTVKNSSDQVLSTVDYGYNIQGRMATVTTTDNASGRVEIVTYDYDSEGIRAASSQTIDTDGDGNVEETKTTEYLTDSQTHTGYAQVIRETTVTGSTTKTIDYLIGHDEIKQVVTTDDGTAITTEEHFFNHDGHGSVRVLTDALGVLVESYLFDAYGVALGFVPANALTSLGYSGEQFDARIGQQYLRARWYDANSGRFNRLDPFAGNSQDPQSYHKYLYTHADPVNGVDPTGLFADVISFLSANGVQSNMRATNQAAQGAARVTAVQRLKTVAHLYQKALRVVNKITNAVDYITDLIDILNFDTKDVRNITDQLGAIGLNSAIDALPNRVVQREIKLPIKMKGKMQQLWKFIFNMGLKHNAVQEFFGELATGIVIDAIGFDLPEMQLDRVHGPDQIGRHRVTGTWGIFEAKGGSATLGQTVTKTGGTQMSGPWITWWLEELYKRNRRTEAGKDLRFSLDRGQVMLAAVTRLGVKNRAGGGIDASFAVAAQKYESGSNGRNMDKWGKGWDYK